MSLLPRPAPKLLSRLMLTLTLGITALPALAETGVIDTPRGTTVEMRSGPAEAFDLIRLLRDGTVVEVLETDPANMWLRVRGPSGAVGWVPRTALENPQAQTDDRMQSTRDTADWIRRDASTGPDSHNFDRGNYGNDTSTATAQRDSYNREQLYVDAPDAGALNLRGGPGTTYAVIETLPHGSTVTLLGGAAPWRRVRSEEGFVGYVHDGYLSAQAPVVQAPRAVPEPPNDGRVLQTLYVDAPRYGALNLRAGPGTQYDIRETMPQGTRVEVLQGGTPDWHFVRSESGELGFASINYLSTSRPAAAATRDDRPDYDSQGRRIIRITPNDLPGLLAACAFAGDVNRCIARQMRDR